MEAAQTSRRSLGELFVERGLISQSDLELALEEQAATKRRLADILVQRGLVTGRDITSALMEQLGSAAPAQAGPVAEGAPAPDDVPSPESTADVIVLPQPAFAAVAEPEVTQSLAGDEFDLTPGSDPAPTPSAAAPEGLPVPGHDLIAEADARCRNAEADLSAARESHARVLRELEQVRTDLDAQEQEPARRVANWQDARDETER